MSDYASAMGRVQELEAEVNRLREKQQTYADTYARNMERQRAEIDRLKAEVFQLQAELDATDG